MLQEINSMKGVSRRKKLVFRMNVLQGMPLRQTCKWFGISHKRARQIRKEVMKKMPADERALLEKVD